MHVPTNQPIQNIWSLETIRKQFYLMLESIAFRRGATKRIYLATWYVCMYAYYTYDNRLMIARIHTKCACQIPNQEIQPHSQSLCWVFYLPVDEANTCMYLLCIKITVLYATYVCTQHMCRKYARHRRVCKKKGSLLMSRTLVIRLMLEFPGLKNYPRAATKN